MVSIRQSRPDCGLGVPVKVLETVWVVPLSVGARRRINRLRAINNNYFAEIKSGFEEGSYSGLMDGCITYV